MENNYTEIERLNIVLDIIKKLKNFNVNNEIIDLYKSNYSYYQDFKNITNIYIKDGITQKGFIDFNEIGKKIEFNFPQKKYKNPLFVIRMK